MLRALLAVALTVLAVSIAAPTTWAAKGGHAGRHGEQARHGAHGAGAPRHMRRLRAAERRLERELQRSQQQLLVAQDARDAAQARYERAIELYTQHVVELYEQGETDRLAALIAARGIDEVLDRASLVADLVEYDRTLVAEYREAAQRAAEESDAVDRAQDRFVDASGRLDDVRAELASYEEPAPVSDLDAMGDIPVPTAGHFFTTDPLPVYGGGSYPYPAGYGGMLGGGTISAAPAVRPDDMPGALRPTGQIETGLASWYGPGFHGQDTANGETYDMFSMTAAHRTLPLGTWVKVTADNGRAVFVRINDRGPFVDGRIIDLSYAAAQRLGMDGVMPVQVSVYG